jgi:hypothetical protein
MRSRLALTLGVALVLIGSLPAQRGPFRPPIPPPPPIRQPGMPGTGIGSGMGMPEKTWHCPKCNREVGRGLFAPTSVSCCGVNYFAGHSMPSGFGPTPPATNPQPVIPPATNPPGIGIPEKSWHCPKCNRQLGTGLLPPASATCCGTTYVGGHGLPGFNPPPMPANPDPVVPPAPAPVFVPPAPAPAAPAASSFNGGIIASIIGIVLFGLFIVAGVAVMIIQNQAASRPSRPRRRRRDEDDDDRRPRRRYDDEDDR